MSAFDPLRTFIDRDNMAAMRLNSVTANRHILNNLVNGKPLRLLLNFDGDTALRLQVAGDGEQMIVGEGPLDTPFDMAKYGRTDVADVTQSLFPTLEGAEVALVEALALRGKRVGLKLHISRNHPFYFWVDGDELHWGDGAALASHDWLDGEAPQTSERVEF